jgi:parallel beta-helix repeat protein
LDNNTFTDGRNGLNVYRSNDNEIFDNDFSRTKGAYISMSNRPPGCGIKLEESDNNTMVRNNCSFSTYGGGFGAYGIIVDSLSDYNVMSCNTCDWNEGTGVSVSGSHNTARNNSISYNDGGISVSGSMNLIDNSSIISSANSGIYVSGDTNTITSNAVESSGGAGVTFVSQADFNTLRHNRLVNDGYFPDWDNFLDMTNTVNGRPLYFLTSQDGGTVPSGAGQIVLRDCSNVVVEDQNLSKADVGLIISGCDHCVIRNITCVNGDTGVEVSGSYSNTICQNNLSGNREYGMSLTGDSNQVFENGFFDNAGYGLQMNGNFNRVWNNTFARNNGAGPTYSSDHVQAWSYGTNYWNSTRFGNYWSDWLSPDIDFDGIVDFPYVLDTAFGSPMDYYPRTTPLAIIPTEPIPEFRSLALLVTVISLMLLVVASRRRFSRI